MTESSRKGKRKATQSLSQQQRYPVSGKPHITFDTEKQMLDFTKHFSGREVLPPRYVCVDYIDSAGYMVVKSALLKCDLLKFFEMRSNGIPEDLLRAFYYSMKIDKKFNLYSRVNGIDIQLSMVEFGCLLSLPFEGEVLGGEECQNFVEEDTLRMLNLIPKRTRSGRPKIEGLSSEHRYLLYLITRILQGRKGSHTQMYREDLEIIYAILNHRKVNWAMVVLQHMHQCREVKKFLPYPFAVTQILAKYGLHGDVLTTTDPRYTWPINKATFRSAREDVADEEEAARAPADLGAREQPKDMLQQILKGIQKLQQDVGDLRDTQLQLQQDSRAIRRTQRRHQHTLESLSSHIGLVQTPASESDED